MKSKETWLGPEEHAYNTYSGAHSGSRRKACCLCPDGKLRIVTCGVPDTYFTIPAHCRVSGKYVAGYITSAPDGTITFNPNKEYKHVFQQV